MTRRRILILGAAGRDFHNFNTVFRDDTTREVVAFTATQIPGIDGRLYPPSLAGALYPGGIPIHPESELERLVADLRVDEVILAYSDIDYGHVGSTASRVLAAGADFRLLGTTATFLESQIPVVAVTAVRTGCGKSQTSRYLARALREAGMKVVVVRHPMPYGDLAAQAVQRFATYEDMDLHRCTFEEREEYEAHVAQGIVVYAGVDYSAILAKASREADVIIWDGGNNDPPFFRPDVWIAVLDPLRPGHETRYYPGEVNLRACHVAVINKATSAPAADVEAVARTITDLNPTASIHRTASVVRVPDPEAVRGKRVLCVEDGPTLTHGDMAFGAGRVAAELFGAAEVVDPRPFAVGSIAGTLREYPHIGELLPAMGYFPDQIADLEASIRAVECDLVLVATPFDLGARLSIDKPALRVTYHSEDIPGDGPTLAEDVLLRVGAARRQ